MSEREKFIKLVQEFKDFYEKSEQNKDNKGKIKFMESLDLFIFGWEGIVKYDRYGESYYKCEIKNVKYLYDTLRAKEEEFQKAKRTGEEYSKKSFYEKLKETQKEFQKQKKASELSEREKKRG